MESFGIDERISRLASVVGGGCAVIFPLWCRPDFLLGDASAGLMTEGVKAPDVPGALRSLGGEGVADRGNRTEGVVFGLV